jgi:predicted cupin superfamily sugar epimerase
MNTAAEKIIAQLGLAPLPGEGGFFRQIGVSPVRLPNGRSAASEIWFLLTADDFSALHQLQAEEEWTFAEGDSVEHVQLGAAGRVCVLGGNSSANELTRIIVPGRIWQGARIKRGRRSQGYALLRCTVRPAWDEAEFKLGERDALLREFPAKAEWIRALTR